MSGASGGWGEGRAAQNLRSPPRGGRLLPLRFSPLPRQHGDTALDFAARRNHTEVVRLLGNEPASAAQVGRTTPQCAAPAPAPAPAPTPVSTL
eukprot:scaffold21913_cov51-Phaeocystis_antarctica.AAC.1